jgi:uncharacterized protein
MRILRAADRMAAPWKNGGGVTREVAIWPPGASLTAFDWRISIADVEMGGPFSSFPGVDRVLTVIGGRGLVLAVAGAAQPELDENSRPLAFSGDAPCEAVLRDGPIRDLNLMVRRGAHAVQVRRMSVAGETEICCSAETTLLLALDPVRLGDERLEPEDAVLADRGEPLRVSGHGVRLVVAQIDPA